MELKKTKEEEFSGEVGAFFLLLIHGVVISWMRHIFSFNEKDNVFVENVNSLGRVTHEYHEKLSNPDF